MRNERGTWTGSQTPVDLFGFLASQGVLQVKMLGALFRFLASVVDKDKNASLAKLRRVLWYTAGMVVHHALKAAQGRADKGMVL